ncbi:MAG: tyrosine--tRNA ligase [Planctomycetes bacterium]|nr:tyrosine--tRNA ligase [Planctomycetota bacterium]MBI3848554.1 tyrosine--tRNA ligase [Planctomycetota bacterium]
MTSSTLDRTADPSESAEVERQLAIIRRRAVEVWTEDDLRRKLLRSIRTGNPLRVKLGMDPTSPDLHLGHYVPLRKLREFQDLGHQAVLIIGTYTAMVGDPSGRNKTRPQLDETEIERNLATYLEQVSAIVDASRLEIRRNGEWFSKMSFAEVIRLTAMMTVGQMLARNDFAKRHAEQAPISIHEFLYPLMQGWDSVVVKADVELGGTDQTFNLHVGREFQTQKGDEPQVCLTGPLIEGLDGSQKMSKSYGNAIGIREPSRDMFGKVMSIPDALMRRYFELLTDRSAEEISRFVGADSNPRESKELLARDVVARFHGTEAATREAEEFRRVFTERQSPTNVPAVDLSRSELREGAIWVVRLLVAIEFATSNSEARTLVRQKAVEIDGTRVSDEKANVPVRDGVLVRVGRHRFARLRVVER